MNGLIYQFLQQKGVDLCQVGNMVYPVEPFIPWQWLDEYAEFIQAQKPDFSDLPADQVGRGEGYLPYLERSGQTPENFTFDQFLSAKFQKMKS